MNTAIRPGLWCRAMAMLVSAHWLAFVLAAWLIGRPPATTAVGAGVAVLGGVLAWQIFRRVSGRAEGYLPFVLVNGVLAGTDGYTVRSSLEVSVLWVLISLIAALALRDRPLPT